MDKEKVLSMLDLSGKHALVTGGATGIGFATAQALSACGASVTIVGRSEAKLAEAVNELGEQASYRVFDVTQPEKAPALVDEICKAHGRLDFLVNNAGVHLKKPAEEVSEEEFRHVLDVHIIGSAALSRHASKAMRRNASGSIVFIASMASLFGIPNLIAYSAAKTAMLGMVRTLSTEWSPHGIRINAIAPGWIATDMMRKAVDNDPERKNKILSRTPMRQFGETEDIGWTVAYLCSPMAKFVTGICLPVDGGAAIGF